MRQSNYDIMRDRMQFKFLEYDQQHMIDKFNLEYDEEYLYLSFIVRPYRIDRKTGKVEWSEDGFLTVTGADYNEAMTIFDVLCYSKDGCCLSGRFTTANMLKGVVQTAHLGENFFQASADHFNGKTEKLNQACKKLGGKAGKTGSSGDVNYILYPFSFLPVQLQFWEADEEFAANLRLLLDENILQYMHYETIYFMLGHLLKRIRQTIENLF